MGMTQGKAWLRGVVMLGVVWGLWPSWPAGAAALPEFTPAQKAAYVKTLKSGDPRQTATLTKEYADWEMLRQSESAAEKMISELHYRNEEALLGLRRKVKQIDEAKLAGLRQISLNTKQRYQRLFDLYRSVNLQLGAARKIGNKTLTEAFRTQAESLKIPVQLARQDIRQKDEAYGAAKLAAQAKIKKIRDVLSAVDPLEVKIRAGKSTWSAPRESRWTVWKALTAAFARQDAATAGRMFASVNELSRQIADRQQKVLELENRISAVIRSAEALLPSSGYRAA
jgi:hypothetical protein